MSQINAGIPRYQARALAAPGANTSFASFTLSHPVASVRITIALATASVLNLFSTDGTTGYTHGLLSSATLTAGDLYAIDVPGLTRYVPSGGKVVTSAGTEITYSLRIETNGVVQVVSIVELPTGDL